MPGQTEIGTWPAVLASTSDKNVVVMSNEKVDMSELCTAIVNRIDPNSGLQVICITRNSTSAMAMNDMIRKMGTTRTLVATAGFGSVRIGRMNPVVVIGLPNFIKEVLSSGQLELVQVRLVVLYDVGGMLSDGGTPIISKGLKLLLPKSAQIVLSSVPLTSTAKLFAEDFAPGSLIFGPAALPATEHAHRTASLKSSQYKAALTEVEEDPVVSHLRLDLREAQLKTLEMKEERDYYRRIVKLLKPSTPDYGRHM